jgi:hypothetical protein
VPITFVFLMLKIANYRLFFTLTNLDIKSTTAVNLFVPKGTPTGGAFACYSPLDARFGLLLLRRQDP